MTREEQVKEVLEVVDEVEDMVEVRDRLFATTTDNKGTMCEIIPIPLLLVSIASPMIVLLKNVLFYKLSGRKRGHRWETKMFS